MHGYTMVYTLETITLYLKEKHGHSPQYCVILTTKLLYKAVKLCNLNMKDNNIFNFEFQVSNFSYMQSI